MKKVEVKKTRLRLCGSIMENDKRISLSYIPKLTLTKKT